MSSSSQIARGLLVKRHVPRPHFPRSTGTGTSARCLCCSRKSRSAESRWAQRPAEDCPSLHSEAAHAAARPVPPLAHRLLRRQMFRSAAAARPTGSRYRRGSVPCTPPLTRPLPCQAASARPLPVRDRAPSPNRVRALRDDGLCRRAMQGAKCKGQKAVLSAGASLGGSSHPRAAARHQHQAHHARRTHVAETRQQPPPGRGGETSTAPSRGPSRAPKSWPLRWAFGGNVPKPSPWRAGPRRGAAVALRQAQLTSELACHARSHAVASPPPTPPVR